MLTGTALCWQPGPLAAVPTIMGLERVEILKRPQGILIGKNLTDEETYFWKNDVPVTDSNSYLHVGRASTH